MPIKLKKTLYVGLGGTGVATLLKVKKCFYDSYGEIPPMIGFLAIDTDGAATSKDVTANDGSKIKLDSSELLVCTVKGALSVYHTNTRDYDWVPSKNVDKLAYIQAAGAGQVRSNGRFIAYYNNSTIKSNVQACINKIMQLIPNGSKYAVDLNNGGVEYPVNINVVTSVAGGTGSGMLVDVLCLIREAVQAQAINFKLYPWIVLPEVFKAMNAGPSMANVLYNAYGAIRTLDYLQHYDPKDAPINFGYAKVTEPLFDYAYLINNTNQAGTTFDTLDDLTDAIAKSAYLPANKMGDEILSPFDNIANQKAAGTYDILNKKAWAASASSAEMIYDAQAVGRAYAYSIIQQLCASMQQWTQGGANDANNFFDDTDVLIRENNGRNDVIDHLLSPDADYILEIDENTTTNDINIYLDNNYAAQKFDPILKEKLDKKVASTKKALDEYLKDIMARPQGKVEAAVQFVEALQDIADICKGEMTQEKEFYNKLNAVPAQWDVLVNQVTNKGVSSLFRKVNNEAVKMLRDELKKDVMNHREEMRRDWALRFYATFDKMLEGKRTELSALKTTIAAIGNNNRRMLLEEQHSAYSMSKFQIFLHDKDVMKASAYVIDDDIRTEFVNHFSSGISSWTGQSKGYMQDKLWEFVKNTKPVKDAVNTSIDDVLARMDKSNVKQYLRHLQVLASPLWTYNTQGFNNQQLMMDKFVVVGVANRDNNILSKDYGTFFDVNGNKASFASTNQKDRVYLLVVEDLLPVYAVNNFSSYEQDNDIKQARGVMMANYLDEKLNNRINSENFSLKPTVETDNVLQYWAWGFVFGYINFDVEQGKYWIRSKSHGKAIYNYRFNLANQRDVAYDIFRSEGLYKEVKDALDNEIKRTGRQPIEDKINVIKEAGNYFSEYAQLSPLERDNIEAPNFKAVYDLVEQEIQLMTM